MQKVSIIELPADENCIGNSFYSDIDSCNDDQINQTDKPGSVLELKNQIPIPQSCFLIFKFCLSVWQPPKNS